MAFVAASRIKHGRGEKGSSLIIEEGEKVSKKDFSAEEWNALLEAGAVVQEGAEDEVPPGFPAKTSDVEAPAPKAGK